MAITVPKSYILSFLTCYARSTDRAKELLDAIERAMALWARLCRTGIRKKPLKGLARVLQQWMNSRSVGVDGNS